MLASCMAMPRFGHLKEVLNVFAYLKKYHNTKMVFDPTTPAIKSEDFEREDWSYTVYGENGIQPKEEMPPGIPEAREARFIMSLYVDANHAGDHVTRRSRTGFLVFLQRYLIHWSSKKQTLIETSTFGSEFMAMKPATEYIIGLRYKLRMMGIPVVGPCLVQDTSGDAPTSNQKIIQVTYSPRFLPMVRRGSISARCYCIICMDLLGMLQRE